MLIFVAGIQTGNDTGGLEYEASHSTKNYVVLKS